MAGHVSLPSQVAKPTEEQQLIEMWSVIGKTPDLTFGNAVVGYNNTSSLSPSSNREELAIKTASTLSQRTANQRSGAHRYHTSAKRYNDSGCGQWQWNDDSRVRQRARVAHLPVHCRGPQLNHRKSPSKSTSKISDLHA